MAPEKDKGLTYVRSAPLLGLMEYEPKYYRDGDGDDGAVGMCGVGFCVLGFSFVGCGDGVLVGRVGVVGTCGVDGVGIFILLSTGGTTLISRASCLDPQAP